jgi:hypothetical protein
LYGKLIYQILTILLGANKQNILHNLWPRQVFVAVTSDAAPECNVLFH